MTALFEYAWLNFLLGRWAEPSPHPLARAKALAHRAFDFYVSEGGTESR